ncbi:MAG: cation:proton antiporter, partial [Gammaproteobacteria bacterium]
STGRFAGKAICALLLGLCAPTSALAAGGDMPSLVHDIGISLLTAGLIALVFNRFKIPSIAAFLLAGILIGPLGIEQVTDPENVDTIAQLGFILLLFLIGLEIDFKKIFGSGKAITLSGLLQYPLTILFGIGATKLLIVLGIGTELLGSSPYSALYLGVIIAGSSTLLVVKLFQENFELDTEPGRLALGMLIFQDIWVIIVILIQPNIQSPELGPIAMSFLGIAVLSVFSVMLAQMVFEICFEWIAKSPELTLTAALAWCFTVVFFGANMDIIAQLVFGVNPHMAVGAGMSALIAGACIANLPSATEVITRVSTVKDFFITLFFVALGISIPAPDGWGVVILAFSIAIIALLARLLVFFPLFYFTGLDQRNAMVGSVRLAQISEFGLVIVFLGVQYGHIDANLSAAVIFAFVITALATPVLYAKAYDIHRVLQPVLEKIGIKAPPERREEHGPVYDLALLGFHRQASSLLSDLTVRDPELVRNTLVVDFNVAIHPKIAATGATVKYGDLSNSETLHHLGLSHAKVVICTIPDDLLRGINNRELVGMVREMNESAVIIANAISFEEIDKIYLAGADYVYMTRLEAADALGTAVHEALANRIEVFREQNIEKYRLAKGRHAAGPDYGYAHPAQGRTAVRPGRHVDAPAGRGRGDQSHTPRARSAGGDRRPGGTPGRAKLRPLPGTARAGEDPGLRAARKPRRTGTHAQGARRHGLVSGDRRPIPVRRGGRRLPPHRPEQPRHGQRTARPGRSTPRLAAAGTAQVRRANHPRHPPPAHGHGHRVHRHGRHRLVPGTEGSAGGRSQRAPGDLRPLPHGPGRPHRERARVHVRQRRPPAHRRPRPGHRPLLRSPPGAPRAPHLHRRPLRQRQLPLAAQHRGKPHRPAIRHPLGPAEAADDGGEGALTRPSAAVISDW